MADTQVCSVVKSTFLYFFEPEVKTRQSTQRGQSLPARMKDTGFLAFSLDVAQAGSSIEKFKNASDDTLSCLCDEAGCTSCNDAISTASASVESDDTQSTLCDEATESNQAAELNKVSMFEEPAVSQQDDAVTMRIDGFQVGRFNFNWNGQYIGVAEEPIASQPFCDYAHETDENITPVYSLYKAYPMSPCGLYQDTGGHNAPACNLYKAYPMSQWFEQAPAMPQAQEVSKEPIDVKRLIIYNIPFQVTVKEIINLIIARGFGGTYNSIYLPASRGRGRNEDGECEAKSESLGYAFINFKVAANAAKFLDIFQNISFPNCDSEKLACTKPAHKQGCSGTKRRPMKGGRGKY